MNPSILLLHKYFWSTSSIPTTILGTGNITVKKDRERFLPSWSSRSIESRDGESKRKQIRIQIVISATKALEGKWDREWWGMEVRSELSQVGPGRAVWESDFCWRPEEWEGGRYMKNQEENFPRGTNSKWNIFEDQKEGPEWLEYGCLVREVVVVEGGEVGEMGSLQGPRGHREIWAFMYLQKEVSGGGGCGLEAQWANFYSIWWKIPIHICCLSAKVSPWTGRRPPSKQIGQDGNLYYFWALVQTVPLSNWNVSLTLYWHTLPMLSSFGLCIPNWQTGVAIGDVWDRTRVALQQD